MPMGSKRYVHMFDDFKELLSVLNACKVKYLVVGGYAVSYHAQPRATKDLDILIKPSTANSLALLSALKEFGAPVDDLSLQDFSERGKFFRMGAPPIMVDILPEIAGVGFDAAWKRRVMVTVDVVTPSRPCRCRCVAQSRAACAPKTQNENQERQGQDAHLPTVMLGVVQF